MNISSTTPMILFDHITVSTSSFICYATERPISLAIWNDTQQCLEDMPPEVYNDNGVCVCVHTYVCVCMCVCVISIINHTLVSTIRAAIGTLTCMSMGSNSTSDSECY